MEYFAFPGILELMSWVGFQGNTNTAVINANTVYINCNTQVLWYKCFLVFFRYQVHQTALIFRVVDFPSSMQTNEDSSDTVTR
jgi:hypothetical protein